LLPGLQLAWKSNFRSEILELSSSAVISVFRYFSKKRYLSVEYYLDAPAHYMLNTSIWISSDKKKQPKAGYERGAQMCVLATKRIVGKVVGIQTKFCQKFQFSLPKQKLSAHRRQDIYTKKQMNCYLLDNLIVKYYISVTCYVSCYTSAILKAMWVIYIECCFMHCA